jgi:hypothetical protein
VEADEEVGADRHKPAQRVSMGRELDLAPFSLRSLDQNSRNERMRRLLVLEGRIDIGQFSATASPYICLTECCTAIRLLRDAFVARLEGSFESSAR